MILNVLFIICIFQNSIESNQRFSKSQEQELFEVYLVTLA